MTSAVDEYAATPQPRHVELSEAVAQALQQAAQADTQHEVCGLLLGLDQWRDGTLLVDEIAPSPNLTRGAAQDSFEIDPALHLRLRRDLRGTGRTVVGLYHSHPNGSSHPSEADHQGARLEPGLLWLIVPLDKAGLSGYPAAYWATRHLLSPVPLRIGSPAAKGANN